MSNADNKLYDKRWIILLTTVLLAFMSTLDSSIVNVALPVMAKELQVSMASIEWVITSYLIVIVGAILIFGRLADIKGKATIFKSGIIIFTMGSLACGISNSLGLLVLSRGFQAIGASATMATSHGIITHVFPSSERGKALGVNGTFVALGAMIGPPIGGLIVSAVRWNYIFLINLPIGIVAFILAKNTLPKNSKNINEKLDLKGGIVFALTIILVFGALTYGKEVGFSKPIILLCFILAIIFFIAFIKLQRKIAMPLLNLNMFKNCLFSLSIFCAFISFVAIASSSIIIPFYLQDVMKLTPSLTGLLLMIFPVILVIIAPISGYISDRVGSDILTFIGLIGTSLGLLLMSTLNQYSSLVRIIAFIGIMTLGNGMFQVPNNSIVMSTVPKNKLGIAGSINALVRNLGMVVGVSLSTTILYSSMSSKLGYHVTGYIIEQDDVFIYGMRNVFIAAAISSAIGVILTAYRLYGNKGKIKEIKKIG